MATFAEIDNNNLVVRIIKVDDAEAPTPITGEQYCKTLLGGNWRQCSYNTSGNVHGDGGTPFRKNMPAVGWTWDEAKNGFIEPQPHDSWTLNNDTGLWEAPVAKPTTQNVDENTFVYGTVWNESAQRWEATEYDDAGNATSNTYYWHAGDLNWQAI
tara:strand:- start:461 stop:928 length:468 start_codon:yes stop_codon:yes gene_type:complete